ncbi:NAD(P)/FAD-dependent oxidoreductase [Pedobacter sp. SYP-B3415]|uniref:NAD(P)/FAD-dependent oxidoreductase n=1 Tax=Pedobacter sp. SYP-B3415 TaxID=2496641 RepID=UPI00101D552A|nr:NAD(P)/FAD-dependent oxidoreductase [Pedobacter sp. SYP-B3415]
MEQKNFDVIVIGGSFAGLAASLALGRARRTVLVIDSGQACNRYTPHAHNLLGFDGVPPAEIRQKAKSDVSKYPGISFLSDTAVSAVPAGAGFKVETAGGASYHARKLFFGTGVRDLFPAIEGFEDCWGRSIVHCPYCHGYELADKPTALFAAGDDAMHFAKLLPQWAGSLTLVTNDRGTFSLSQLEYFKEHNIPVITSPISGFVHSKGMLSAIRFEEGPALEVEAMYARIPFKQHCELPEQLGCLLNSDGLLMTNEMQETTVEGVYAGGDNTTQMRSLANAIALGTKAGAIINGALLN